MAIKMKKRNTAIACAAIVLIVCSVLAGLTAGQNPIEDLDIEPPAGRVDTIITGTGDPNPNTTPGNGKAVYVTGGTPKYHDITAGPLFYR